MKLSSSAFEYDKPIPDRYTCEGENISPPLSIEDVPSETKSMVLLCEDPDAPGGLWDHWIVFNIPPTLEELDPGEQPQGTLGKNSWGKTEYGGPCPPSGVHHYHFTLYALDEMLPLTTGATKQELTQAMDPHIIDKTTLIGTYKRK